MAPKRPHELISDPEKSTTTFARYEPNYNKKYGEGGYGATFAATDKSTGEALAVKIVDMRRMKSETLRRECHILETLEHESVIKVKAHCPGVGKFEHLYFIFMELAGGGELFDQVIQRGANAMTEQTARDFFLQILDGVNYCHIAGVAHRDLKLENVLLNEQGRVKLIDFGLSHIYPKGADGSIDRSTRLHDVCGSKSYAAPEVLTGGDKGSAGYDGFAADMWSLGVCLFAMLSGFFPLDEATASDWRYPKLEAAQNTGLSTIDTIYRWYKRSAAHLSKEVQQLLNGLLTVDVHQRLSMQQVREHPWVTGKKLRPPDFTPVMVDEGGPAYRGVGAMPMHGFEANDQMMIDEDEMPVYRSMPTFEDEFEPEPAEPAALPGLTRQKGALNLFDIGPDESLVLP